MSIRRMLVVIALFPYLVAGSSCGDPPAVKKDESVSVATAVRTLAEQRQNIPNPSRLAQSAQPLYFLDTDFDLVARTIEREVARGGRLWELMYTSDIRVCRDVARTGNVTEALCVVISARRISRDLFRQMAVNVVAKHCPLDENDAIGRFLVERIVRDCATQEASEVLLVGDLRDAFDRGVMNANTLFRFLRYCDAGFWRALEKKSADGDFAVGSTWTFEAISEFCSESRPSDREMMALPRHVDVGTAARMSQAGLIPRLYAFAHQPSKAVDTKAVLAALEEPAGPNEDEVVEALRRLCVQQHRNAIREAIDRRQGAPGPETRRLLR